MTRGHLVFALSVITSFLHSVLPLHQSLSSQLLLHPCMDLNETWYRCCTTSLEVTCIYDVWEHRVSLNYRITWWILTKLGRDKVLVTPAHLYRLLGQICLGVNPGQGHNRSMGPSPKDFFFKWPSHISVWALRMPAYDDFLSFVVIRRCTPAARREVVERALRARCHTHSYVGARCVRREILCMHKNSLRITPYADVRPVRSEHAMHTLCERSARPRHGRRTLTERPQYTDVGGHKMCQFHDEPSACW